MLQRIAKARLAAGAFVGPTLEQAGKGEAALGQLPFPTPEQAGKAGADAADVFNQQFNKSFVFASQAGLASLSKALPQNPFFTEVLPDTVAEPVAEGVKKALEQLASEEIKAALSEKFAEAQGPIVETFAATGTKSGDRFVEGFEPISGKIQSLAQSWYQTIASVFSTPIQVNFQSSGGGGGLIPLNAAGGVDPRTRNRNIGFNPVLAF